MCCDCVEPQQQQRRNVESALVIRVIYGFIDSSYSRDKQQRRTMTMWENLVRWTKERSSGEWSEKPYTQRVNARESLIKSNWILLFHDCPPTACCSPCSFVYLIKRRESRSSVFVISLESELSLFARGGWCVLDARRFCGYTATACLHKMTV